MIHGEGRKEDELTVYDDERPRWTSGDYYSCNLPKDMKIFYKICVNHKISELEIQNKLGIRVMDLLVSWDI